MSKEEIQDFVNGLELPLGDDKELYLRLGGINGEYVDSYGPVESIDVLDHSINIRNVCGFSFSGNPIIYNHSFDSFDGLEVVERGSERDKVQI